MVGIGYEVTEAVPRIVRKSLAAKRRGMTPLEPSREGLVSFFSVWLV
jgi:hypothetical protein